MGRHKVFTGHVFLRRMFALTARLQRRPTGQELAEALGVSNRTAWRYIRLFMECEECPRCNGSGWIKTRK